MRIAKADVFGVGQAHAAVQLHRIGFGLLARQDAVDDRPLAILVDQPVRGVEAGSRRLRHIGDALAAQAAPLRLGGAAQVYPVKVDGPARDAAAVAGKAHCRQSQRRLARPGFADQPQHLAPVQGQVHALDDCMPGVAGPPFDLQALDGQKHRFFHRTIPSTRWPGATASPPRSSPPPSAAQSPRPATAA